MAYMSKKEVEMNWGFDSVAERIEIEKKKEACLRKAGEKTKGVFHRGREYKRIILTEVGGS